MIDNTKVYKCACRVKGLTHAFTADASGKWVLMVDPHHARLLRDASWSVSPVHRKSKLLRARATTSAPRIKVGRQLHKLILRVWKGRRVGARNRSYLDCRRANLRSLSYADARILSSTQPSTKAVGVERPPQPRFFKTLYQPYRARIRVNGKDLCLGYFPTLEEAQAAWDAAAIKVHGPTATTNQSLGLLSAEVASTKPCRNAAKMARRMIKEYWSGELSRRYEALKQAKTYAERRAIFAGLQAVGRPTQGPRLEAGV